MPSRLMKWLKGWLKYEEMDSELLEIIDKCVVDKFSNKIEYFSYFIFIGIVFLRSLMAFGLLETDEDLEIRCKVIPVLAVIFYILSQRLQ